MNGRQMKHALKSIPEVESVSYEFPGFWLINTTKGEYHLGTANGPYGWNNPEGTIVGESTATNTGGVIADFKKFLKEIHD